MFEGDDDYKRQIKKAEAKRDMDPHKADELKRKYERKQQQDRSKLRRDIAMKKMKEDKKKLDEEMGKKGIVSINQKLDAKKMIDDKKREAQADKAQGQTEKPTQTV